MRVSDIWKSLLRRQTVGYGEVESRKFKKARCRCTNWESRGGPGCIESSANAGEIAQTVAVNVGVRISRASFSVLIGVEIWLRAVLDGGNCVGDRRLQYSNDLDRFSK